MKSKKISAPVYEIAMIAIGLILTFVSYKLIMFLTQSRFYLNSAASWLMLGVSVLFAGLIVAIIGFITSRGRRYIVRYSFLLIGIIILLLCLILIIFCGAMTQSRTWYHSVSENVTVIQDTEENSAFPNLLGEHNDTSNLPVIGVPEAIRKAETEMGRFPALGSQFVIQDSDVTSQNINGKLCYVIPLQPRSMFKWDKAVGNHGYFIVDRNSGNIEFVEKSLLTTTYAPFGSSTTRIVNKYLNSIGISGKVTDVSPEVDDEGNFHYVATVYHSTFFGSYKTVVGIVEVDAFTKECTFYDTDQIPEYVDRVYPESFFEDYLVMYGSYKNGWLNTLFGEKDILVQTKDMEVIYIDGECWYYTGFTTTGKDDSSNGIIMMNSRTGSIEYHVTYGISEERAMKVVEGLVQEKGYAASYPLLLQVGGQEAYFMLMRDSSDNLVGYAFCSYKDYTKAAVDTTILRAQSGFIATLQSSGNTSVFHENNMDEVKGVISNIASEVLDGTTVYYIRVEGNETTFEMKSDLNIDVVFAEKGTNVVIKYYKSGVDIENIVEVKFG